ncbi:FAD/NAD(P)-binding domain-containing protein [Pseudovirgaria hyperparasitica]|uniref:Kynurenine 3-monooxygenase n=1 Tax=Pseudovirgaria hyperparasitica TaxID=470096 RepID=A0A6A6W2M1_9PEZI|nr:FAD/NAD(P)-binding domain-containing protein [Pseudovirgaria hyperparasitica]KAF2756276.1 FAD/NAD(P)-binding domain-containing protein [Pseudovirgaria hyperparasitica]
MSTFTQKTVVVGAGPVGALAALYAATRGDNVEIYELRGDLRDPNTVPLNFTRSINLALSERGINSLRKADRPALLDAVLKETIPMHGRMIHGKRLGKLFEQSQAYDIHGRAILAVDRGGLNKRLLDELESMPNVKLFFNHKMTGADFKKNLAWFERSDQPRADRVDNRGIEIEVDFDLLIGADGAHSAARFHLMKFARVSYQQDYIDTLWCEFTVPPAEDGSFRLSPNHLHIWPGEEFMFIAIPSLDKSFTCTLFAPVATFTHLDADPDSHLTPFFDTNFPGVLHTLISPAALRAQYTQNSHLPLISIKCTPYHFGSSAVILGDAAHAMVPFYGQGMNAGLEDVRVLYDILDAHAHTSPHTAREAREEARARALQQYTATRHPDATTINDLALRNYTEMRSDVRSPAYKLRKWIEEQLNAWVPALGWATQYSRVSFGNERYSDVERAARHQQAVLGHVLRLAVGSGVGLGLVWAWRADWLSRGLGRMAVVLRRGR